MEPGDSPRGLQRGGEQPLPKPVRDLITKARTSWLKNTEVVDLLQNYSKYRFQLNRETPICPPGGTLYLFNRRVTRFFRRDGHNWRKKADGKTIRETHEKLKVGNKEALNCYYAHADQEDQLQRRCYWMLEGDDSIVLVHYLAGNAAARLRPPGAAPLTAANLARQPRGMDGPSSSDATSQGSFRSEGPNSTASSYSDLGEFARAGSAPERLGSFTFGSGTVRRASDGRCHFTITTGNTQPGPDAMPLAQEGMGALALGRDGTGGAAPLAADGRASSLPSSLGEALQRAQMEHQMAQLAAGAGRGSGFWGQGGGGGRESLMNAAAAAQQAAAAAAAQRHRPPGQWQQQPHQQQPPRQTPSQAAADAAAHLLAWQHHQQALLAAQQQQQQQQQQAAHQQQQQQHQAAQHLQQQQQQQQQRPHASAAELQQLEQQAHHGIGALNHGSSANHGSGFGGGLPSSFGSLPWQAPPDTAWKQAPADPRRVQQLPPQGATERPRLPRAGISAFAAPQVQRTPEESPFGGSAGGSGPSCMEGLQHALGNSHHNSHQATPFGFGA